MSCILENRLWLGSYFDVNEEFLEKKDFGVILGVWSSDKKMYDDIDLPHLELYIFDVEDDQNQDILEYVDWLVYLMDRYNDEVIFVHCFAGISRSASVVIGYLMKEKKISYKKAFDFVKKKREIIKPNSNFVKQLKSIC